MAGCGSVEASPSPEPKEHVRAYMLQALSFIEENSYHVATTLHADWEQVEQSALERTFEAQTTEDTYPVIADVLRKATGDHSFLLTPDEIAAAKSGEREAPSSIMVGRGIATLTIPAFNETAGGLVTEYVNSAIEEIAAQDAEVACGWIVDLRGNGGGNMFPMLLSVAPFMPDGHVMSFSDGTGEETQVSLADMSVSLDGETQLSSARAPPELSNQPLAVLQSGDTASSAEATLISLLSRDNVRSFGGPSAGYATGNVSTRLPDGAMLAVTQSQMLSPDGTPHSGPIAPNEPTDDPKQAAVDWLTTQCSE
ncbi:S41 family peptidase [Arthrobacter tumbae]|uniref:S41 family peptidase n=1 Tax=Arthrobacter tumbae TaxID=163874 RepID=UPI00195CA75E|nr:S41 family peptidase [Arthrobacter tumbae]MBM7782938.1 C-terminal processing protease CtpA/Prc [Arthrobacter tumbae]